MADTATFTAEQVWEIMVKEGATVFGVDPQRITPKTTLADIGADSLDFAEFEMAIEEPLEQEFPDDAFEGITTLGDAYEVVLKHMGLAA